MKYTRKTSRRLNNKERREQIIDVALSVFAVNGFNGTRTREIAEKAGTSEALIFRHFKDKEDLYHTALGEMLDLHSTAIDCREAIASKDDYRVFGTFAKHVFDFNRNDPRSIRLMLFSALESSPTRGTFRPENRKTVMRLLEEYIRGRIEEGAFRKVNAQLASQLFLEAIIMFIVDREAAVTLPPGHFSNEETIDTVVKIFVDGLKAGAC